MSRSTGLESILNRPRPGAWQRFWRAPCMFLAQVLYTWRPPILAQPLADPIAVVCISDTHNSQPEIPEGDVLIHAGDLTQSGSVQELEEQLRWIRAQPHPVKVVVAGNHDLLLDPEKDDGPSRSSTQRQELNWGDIVYLENTAADTQCPNGRTLRFYGSPNSPRHGNWAFQYARDVDVWARQIPDATDILITHGPPRAHLDLLNTGCVHLLRELWSVQPRLHVFGHVHEGYGIEGVRFDSLQAAFERSIIRQGGLLNLLRTFIEFLGTMSHPAKEAKCTLVNPAIVGGLRDELRRKAIKVMI